MQHLTASQRRAYGGLPTRHHRGQTTDQNVEDFRRMLAVVLVVSVVC